MSAKTKRAPTKVVVVWKNPTEGSYGVLSYRDGPRIYDKDKLDPRSGDLPYFSTLQKLIDTQGIGSAHAAQLPVEEAKRFGLI